ncbi:hypothetical protein AB3R30_26715 [Leptolyngbyaceae cyanobacterium UHCC 1019]
MTTISTITGYKGGVGKSTTAMNWSYELCLRDCIHLSCSWTLGQRSHSSRLQNRDCLIVG